VDDYARFRDRLKELSSKLRRTRGESLSRTMRLYLRGRKFRAARKVIKRQLGWHRRWEAEAWIAMNPWQSELGAQVWCDLAMHNERRR
jgi:hypothetical protein